MANDPVTRFPDYPTIMKLSLLQDTIAWADKQANLRRVESRLEQLAGQNFVRCNNGYLVNLRHVRGVEGGDVVVGGDRLLISRTRRKAFLQRMSEYFGGR